uniref:AP-4 complex subunit epsilon-like n=1 Tax=Tanacetum cinerariifolium TaxID=118510 RepID=A0A6L2MTI7_TANCI|nr:AP-4 complex subunit epsilon-like [Tanacetum cinerariifolium]
MEHLQKIGRELALGTNTVTSTFSQSKEFLDLIKSIGEARSKSEEDRIVLRETETLKKLIHSPDIPKRKMKEYILRLVYIEMLGHDSSFGYIHAVKMTHDESVILKRTGYLAVVELLGHNKEAVRKKAVMALHKFWIRSPGSVSHLVVNFRKKLCDNDPGVMGATLCPLYDLITLDVNPYKDLVVSFVNILKQVAERRLPKSYDYHQTPAPFIQVSSYKIENVLFGVTLGAPHTALTVNGNLMIDNRESSKLSLV